MKNYKKTIKNGRFAVEDNGFSANVISRLGSMPDQQMVIPTPRLSAWYEFRLPMIGAAVGILVFGLIVTRIVDLNSWAERYVDRVELFATKLALADRNTLPTPTELTDEDNQ